MTAEGFKPGGIRTPAHPVNRREPLRWQCPKPAAEDPGAAARVLAILDSPSYRRADAGSKADRPRSLESIANTENVNFDKIAGFLRLPHAVMPNLPLSRKEIDDIAASIAQMKR